MATPDVAGGGVGDEGVGPISRPPAAFRRGVGPAGAR